KFKPSARRTQLQPGAGYNCPGFCDYLPMTDTDQQLSLDKIHDLRASLPDLELNPRLDPPLALPQLGNAYLDYYGIRFEDRYFHRWGRVILPPYTVATHYWLPEGCQDFPDQGMVVVVHGYFDHVGLYGHLIRYLLEQGYGVIAFDLPGHGLSSGERASIASLDHYVDVLTTLIATVAAHCNCPLSAIGQSTGGAILLKHLALCCEGSEPCLDRVTLLAPLVEPALWWLNKAVYALTHKKRARVRRKFTRNSSDEAFLAFLEQDPHQATHIPSPWLGAWKRWVEECRAMAPCPFPVRGIQGR